MKKHLPDAWLPTAKMRAVVIHWTGGTNSATDLDRAHYHFIIDGTGKVHRGNHSVKANESPLRAGYAAHCLKFNGGSIGVSLCGMAGATESPFRPGKYPINELQWQTAKEVVAQLCEEYGIKVTYTTVLQHGEVEKRTGVKQRQKWDVNKLPWQPTWTPEQVQRDFRLGVMEALKG